MERVADSRQRTEAQPRSGERMQPTAQAVGQGLMTITSPEGAKETLLIPNILLVVLHVVLLQKRYKLLLK